MLRLFTHRHPPIIRTIAYALLIVGGVLFAPVAADAQTGERRWLETSAPSPAAGKRVALVVGNTHYGGKNDLANPVNDARAIAHTLQALGFDVLMCLDQTNVQMSDDVEEFGNRIQGARVAVFYFAGHGAQVNGDNYLIPIGFNGHSATQIKYQALNVGEVLDKVSTAGSRMNVIILDACRDNPFSDGTRSLTRGLAPITAPGGTLIAYATAPGKTAEDNSEGSNGLFTQELLVQIKTPGLRIEDVFINTRKAVKAASHGEQVPWEESSLEEQFYFAPPPTGVLPPPVVDNPTPTPAVVNPPSPAVNPERPAIPPPSGDTLAAGSIKVNPKDGAEMVLVPAGPFLMGDDDNAIVDYSAGNARNNPRHTVTLGAYYIYKNLVTVSMYRKFCDATGKQMPDAPSWGWKDDHPIVKVSWDDAKAYCDWAGARLPTEAEWEKAARGTDGRKYPWGDDFDEGRLWSSRTTMETHSIGGFPSGASPYGVLDMVGNVSQWCADWSDVNFCNSDRGSEANPVNEVASDRRVLRGSSWNLYDPVYSHAAYQLGYAPSLRFDRLGFRAVAAAGPP